MILGQMELSTGATFQPSMGAGGCPWDQELRRLLVASELPFGLMVLFPQLQP